MKNYHAFKFLKKIYFVRTAGSKEELMAANLSKDEISLLGGEAYLEEFDVDASKIFKSDNGINPYTKLICYYQYSNKNFPESREQFSFPHKGPPLLFPVVLGQVPNFQSLEILPTFYFPPFPLPEDSCMPSLLLSPKSILPKRKVTPKVIYCELYVLLLVD